MRKSVLLMGCLIGIVLLAGAKMDKKKYWRKCSYHGMMSRAKFNKDAGLYEGVNLVLGEFYTTIDLDSIEYFRDKNGTLHFRGYLLTDLLSNKHVDSTVIGKRILKLRKKNEKSRMFTLDTVLACTDNNGFFSFSTVEKNNDSSSYILVEQDSTGICYRISDLGK